MEGKTSHQPSDASTPGLENIMHRKSPEGSFRDLWGTRTKLEKQFCYTQSKSSSSDDGKKSEIKLADNSIK